MGVLSPTLLQCVLMDYLVDLNKVGLDDTCVIAMLGLWVMLMTW